MWSCSLCLESCAMTEKQRTSEVKNVLAGGFGGICTVLSGHPFDTCKVRHTGWHFN